MEEHIKCLQVVCRICTQKLGRVSYPCTPSGEGGESPLFVSNRSDDINIHPPRYCNTCYLTLGRMKKARKEGKVYRTSLTVNPHVYVWSAHTEVGCTTCAMVGGKVEVDLKRGRKSKCAQVTLFITSMKYVAHVTGVPHLSPKIDFFPLH